MTQHTKTWLLPNHPEAPKVGDIAVCLWTFPGKQSLMWIGVVRLGCTSASTRDGWYFYAYVRRPTISELERYHTTGPTMPEPHETDANAETLG
jgi:hypothetical protein